MLNIIYSNRYEVLRQCLIENLMADSRDADIDPIFSPLPVIVPSDAVSDDLMRAMAEHPDAKGVCMGLHLQRISEWMRPYGSLWLGKGAVGKALEWIIWDILEKGELAGALQQDGTGGLAAFLKKASGGLPSLKYELAIRIAAVFTKYINYRFDWVLEWLGEAGMASFPPSERQKEQVALRDGHPEAAWQALLWAKIKERLDGLKESGAWLSRADAKGADLIDLIRKIPQSLAMMDSAEGEDTRALHFYMPQVLPPLALPFLAKEAARREVWLYLTNPCNQYWFGADGTWFGTHEEAVATMDGNAFLHRNAASTRALIDRIWRFAPEDVWASVPLIEEAAPEKHLAIHKKAHGVPWHDLTQMDVAAYLEEDEAETQLVNSHLIYVQRHGTTLLDKMADSILCDAPLQIDTFDPGQDRSLRILKAAGFVRQVEAVVDWIHALKRDDPTVKPEDILVVTPAIDEAAPLIRGVMASQPEDQEIAYRIMGRTALAVNTAATAILKAGALIHSMMPAKRFAEVLAMPLMTAAWSMTLDDVQIIRRWLETAGFRFGIDGEHVRCLLESGFVKGESEASDGTLERAMERLVLGRLTSEGDYVPYGDVLPVYGTENTGFDVVFDSDGQKRLDILTNIYGTFKSLYARTFEKQGPQQWCQWTLELLASLFPVGPDHQDLLDDMDAFKRMLVQETEVMQAALSAGGTAKAIPFEVFWMALEKGFAERPGTHHADGCTVFAGMADFRWLPFKAIAMIGMDDGPVFPGVDRTEEFDLTQPLENLDETTKGLVRRKGDRDSRNDNRNVFLDLLLAASDRVLITYDAGPEPTVASKALNPSIVVQDLLFWLDSAGLDTDSITAIMPLTRYSSGNLWADDGRPRDTVRFFRTSEKQIEDALRGLEADAGHHEKAFVDPDSKPLDAAFPKDSQATINLPFGKLVDVWTRPDTVVRKTVGMSDVAWLETDRTPTLEMPDDKLFVGPLEKRILALLREDAPVDFLKEDPRLGCADIRGVMLTPVVERMQAVKEMIAKVNPNGALLKVPPVCITVGEVSVQIPVPEVVLCQGTDAGAGYLVFTATARERANARLLHLLLCCTGNPKSMYCISWDDDTVELHLAAVKPVDEARAIMAALCQLYDCVMHEKTVFPNFYRPGGFKGAIPKPLFDPLWRHDGKLQDEKNARKKEADDLLEGYTGAALLEVIDLAPPDERGKSKPKKGAKEPATVIEVVDAICALMRPNTWGMPEVEVPNE
jgi:exonuclease V gamma subunit